MLVRRRSCAACAAMRSSRSGRRISRRLSPSALAISRTSSAARWARRRRRMKRRSGSRAKSCASSLAKLKTLVEVDLKRLGQGDGRGWCSAHARTHSGIQVSETVGAFAGSLLRFDIGPDPSERRLSGDRPDRRDDAADGAASGGRIPMALGVERSIRSTRVRWEFRSATLRWTRRASSALAISREPANADSERDQWHG